jgi:hypothetical protein
MTAHAQPNNMASKLADTIDDLFGDDMDLFATMDEDMLAMLGEGPSKRICLGNALLSESAWET